MPDKKFQVVDDSIREQHTHLLPKDTCYFFHEYAAGAGFGAGPGNDLISNLKKPPSRRGRAEYRYKEWAISECARLIKSNLSETWQRDATFVPVPCSKAKDDPEYDDRMEQICLKISNDVRPIIGQSSSRTAFHAGGTRLPPQQLISQWIVDESYLEPPPNLIAIVDDVLTKGSHFRAMSTVLEERFPDVPLCGIFIARCVHPDTARDTDLRW